MPNTSLRKPTKGYGGRGGRGKVAYHGNNSKRTTTFAASGRQEATSADEKWERTRLANTIDEEMGFTRFEAGKKREGWMVNMQATNIEDDRNPGGRAAVDCYFIEDDGGTFKATIEYEPYFLVAVRRGRETEVEEWLKRVPGGGVVRGVKRVEKDDLSMPNHLLGYKRTFLEIRFANVQDLMNARRDIMPIAEKNKKNMDAMDTYAEVATANAGMDMFDQDSRDEDRRVNGSFSDSSDYIVDIREYDVPYHVRVMIDLDLRTSKWYFVEAKHGVTTIICNQERLARADPVVMAYDIETTKLPLKFPDATLDQIMMVSYMIDGQGFLITNREIVSEDISDFEYTPKPEYQGPFMIFNEKDEKALIERFFLHIKEARPTVIATYNGDFFDWPFVEARAAANGIDMYREIGWRKDTEDQYRSKYGIHMDCFHWVNRDSYLPQGSRGLKAVTVAKLGYDPDELDPELMTPYAQERPQTLAEYSVSDAVATYYLYMKYVHPFIFSLCTILPLIGDEVLRKGTGTLCEMLLMVQAYEKEIVLPNKHISLKESFWEGHLLDAETYVGGHVESIEAGVFRADIPVNFAIDTGAIDELLRDLDAALKFSITVEEKKNLDDIVNYEEVKEQIKKQLMDLKETPNRSERPLIYHLDVASMYPNIMTTNRLQPDSMINEADCAACDFNRPGKTCDRRMPWAWRGEYLPAKKDEYNMIRHALENEKFPPRKPGGPQRAFHELTADDQAALSRKRLQMYSQKVYHKIRDTTTIVREAIICQRENPFYINTVRDFRDRRYDYKGKAKQWKGNVESLKSSGAASSEVENAKKMIILFDSMQLAHKVILNSFYGYVMRKGSRWYSMEMAGVTCLTGAHIIQLAKVLVERLGRPLELDTDGIWCMLPATFPENYAFKLKNGKKCPISYPCVMLNHLVHAKFTNHQYQTLADPKTFRYETHSDNSIFFEVDGPYRAMILPTSKEADKNLKKRYAVFNDDGSLAELKGFEVKRRGELKLIKIFQQQIFKFFLEGEDLTECYTAVSKVANRWLDVLYSKGSTLADEELMELISENRSMSKTLEEYGSQKSTSITTAKRLADFLGEQMVKDKGLNCKYIICSKPRGAPVTERAIPVAIFSAEPETKRFYLKKWLKEDPTDTDPRALLDWDYYLERLGSVIQKLITIPAAYQKVRNPVPRVQHPEWLQRRINIKDDKMKQKKLTDLFGFTAGKKSSTSDLLGDMTNLPPPGSRLDNMEDMGTASQLLKPKTVAAALASTQTQGNTGSQKRKSPEPDEHVDPAAGLPKVMPDPSVDYKAFLEYQKKKWKVQKQARIRRRQLFGERRPGAAAQNSNIQQGFRQQAEMTFRSTWQILQLRGTDTPGVVAAYVLIDARIHVVKVKVPRHIYLNLKGRDLPDIEVEKCEVEQVNATLPNGHSSVHLFKLTVDEEVYYSEQEQFEMLFGHASVEGVYETGVPLNMRALLKLGNMCTIDETKPGVLGKGLEEGGFDLSGLIRPSADKRRKLKNDAYLGDTPLGYLYVTQISAGERQVWGVFTSTKEEAYVIVVNRGRDGGGGGGGQEMPNFGRIYLEMLEKKRKEEEQDGGSGESNWQALFRYPDRVQFKVKTVTTRRKAHLELGDVVKKLKKEEHRPLILVVQSSQRNQLVHDVPVMQEFPVLPLRYDAADSALPPLGWQSVVAKRVIGHYLGLGQWISHLTALARYGDVPLCNLERDDPRFLIDVAYARRLQTNNVVLWWSGGPRPDHAGYEKDDVRGPLDSVRLPEINNPGTYATVCIDIEVRNLGVNTILTSSLINELEGADGGGIAFNPDAGGTGSKDAENEILTSEGTFSNACVLVLRDMVKVWWSEACKGSGMADVMVQHLVRWVEHPDSFLYDRTLHYYVQTMSKKALQQLMADFRRVGSQVVHASANRLLVQTSKAEVGNALAYCDYVVMSIKGRPMFHFVDLEVKEYWDYLVWYDGWNYGGRGCDAERAPGIAEVSARIMDGTQRPGDEDEGGGFDTVMSWQMATFLPERLRPVFSDWVVEFINVMHKLKRPGRLADGSQPLRQTQLPIRPPSTNDSLPVGAGGDSAGGKEKTQILLGKTFEKPFKKAIAGLLTQQKREMLHPELAQDYTFPSLPGSHLSAYTGRGDNSILELVKSLCQVLSLDKNVQMEARLIRKDLLQGMFEVREFAKDAQFRNPSRTLVLGQVCCSGCTLARDFEFCRDEELLPVAAESGEGMKQRPWLCKFCGMEFARNDIEERLLAKVEAIVAEWTTQDLKCGKCKQVKGEGSELMEFCTCSGEWVASVDRGEVVERLETYGRVAGVYGLRMLEGVVGEVVSGV